MKSMTDFIMEQEQTTAVTESYTDADLVSDYMSLCAASANMACIYECATIVEFCQANDINMPETLVQEGFSEFMSKIWKGIADFFEKIAEWFKGLVQKTSSVVAKAKLQETIAKLKTRPGEDLGEDIKNKVAYIAASYNVLLDGLNGFRESVLVEITENLEVDTTKDDQKKYNEFLEELTKLTADYKLFATKKEFVKADGTIVNLSSKFQSKVFIGDYGIDFKVNKIAKTDDVVEVLEKINSIKIPENGTKLLKAIDADTKKFKAIQENTVKKIVVPDGTDPLTPDQIEIKNVKNQVPTAEVGDVIEVKVASTWVTSDKTTKAVKECADALAKAFDSVTQAITDICTKEYADLEVSKDDKKQYEKDLAAANKDRNRYDFDKSLKLN